MADAFDKAGLTARKIHRYGWKPSLPDLRDHIADSSELKIQDEVDPRADLPAVFDQGQLGSCTANAVAAAVEYDAKLNGSDPGVLSRLWIYYYERKLEGAPLDQDTGAYGRDGFKVCNKLGVPPEADWPLFRGDPLQTGVAKTTLPDKLEIRWKIDLKKGIESTAAIVKDTVYVGCFDDHLHAYDLANGKHEPIKCRASYDVLETQSKLQLNIHCASESYNFDLRASASHSGDTITGNWSEATRNAAGTLSGKVEGAGFQVVAKRQAFSASLNLVTQGNKQSVTIRSQDEKAEVRGATITMQRS